MGCGKSVPKQLGRRRSSSLGAIFNRQKISIRIGDEVKVRENLPIVIFVFGGPGTKKGKLVEDLSVTFGFKLINVEKFILKELAKDPDEVGNTTGEIIDFVKESPEKITLRWALNEIRKQIEEDKQASYIIDVMPNLKGLVRSPGLVKDPTFELKNFEGFFPISFAINLSVPLAKMVKKKEPEVTKPPTGDQKKDAAGTAGKSDEADFGRTKRRATLFDSSVRPFVEYFNKSGRLVSVDVSSGMLDLIWARMCEVFSDLELPHCCNASTIVLFVFDDKNWDEIDTEKYGIHCLNQNLYIQDPEEPAEKVLSSVRKAIAGFDPVVKAFAVNLAGTTIAKEFHSEGGKQIMFFDDDAGKLDTHIKMQMKGEPCSQHFRGVSSLDDHVYLFPKDTNIDLCKGIAYFMAMCR